MQSNLIVSNENASFDSLVFKNSVVYVSASQSYPYVNTKETEVESLMINKCLKEFFLKAVDITFHDFLRYRKSGIYNYGGAKAELKIVKDKYRLKIETASFEALPDMIRLQEMIYAGTIRPTISYENRQFRMIRIFLAKFKK